ncbi:hypothetical protein ACI6PS_06350 [Flavobacterium sp. PLA-1-15]|uniref:hypothetical protein n=1 Tax=Flavobacterium sp. PLA-1-15 TaxID=3380533 RepID=UPI003B7718BE
MTFCLQLNITDDMEITLQLLWLFILAIPIACVAWTVTHEEVFREPREYCVKRSKKGKILLERKFFYLFTCEYCFSHYVTVFFIIFTDFRLLLDDWRGYVIAGFALIWVANTYMSLMAYLRQGIKKEKTEISLMEEKKEEL